MASTTLTGPAVYRALPALEPRCPAPPWPSYTRTREVPHHGDTHVPFGLPVGPVLYKLDDLDLSQPRTPDRVQDLHVRGPLQTQTNKLPTAKETHPSHVSDKYRILPVRFSRVSSEGHAPHQSGRRGTLRCLV